MRRKLTLWTTLQTVTTLRQLALSLGYIQDRGPAKGQGSISGMIEALAQNQLEIRRKDTKSCGTLE